MRLCLLLIAMLAVVSTASAQESCDVRSTVEERGKDMIFQQLMFCGDGDPVITLTCKSGSKTIKAGLPLSSFSKGKGETVVVELQIGGKTIKRRLRIVTQNDSEIALETNDPLWKALSTVGTDIPAKTDEYTTSIGIVAESKARFEEWKGMCGF
jgi:hypothetical protein